MTAHTSTDPEPPVLHRAFGLRLRLDRPLPGLPALEGSAEADVRVWLGRMPPWLRGVPEATCPPWYVSPFRDGQGTPLLRGWKLRGETYCWLGFSDGVQFVVDRRGTEIWCRWPRNLTREDAASHLLGMVLGFVLRLRGTLCLHASAVAAGGRAIALLGPECAGKSTLAAALAGRGHPVVTDDLVALLEREETVLVQPGFPWLRLRPPPPEGLRDACGASPRLTATRDGLYLDLDLTQEGYRFQNQALPLGAIYLLAERRDEPAAPWIEPVAGGAALVALLAHTWATRMLDAERRAWEFAQLARLGARVPLRRVHPHTDPRHFPRLCDLVLGDYLRLLSSPSILALTRVAEEVDRAEGNR
jgi:hypothetical protein